jgi:multidrug transporter EmrE-like cation transporter
MITTKGLSLMILAGIAAASTTVFGLLAYARGFKLSSSPLMTAIQMSVVLLVGFVFLKEPFTIGRLLALILIALGILVLQRQGV